MSDKGSRESSREDFKKDLKDNEVKKVPSKTEKKFEKELKLEIKKGFSEVNKNLETIILNFKCVIENQEKKIEELTNLVNNKNDKTNEKNNGSNNTNPNDNFPLLPSHNRENVIGVNDSVRYAKLYSEKTKSIILTPEQDIKVKESVNELNIIRQKTRPPGEPDKYITRDEKKELVAKEMNLMARTMAIRAGKPGTVEQAIKILMNKDPTKSYENSKAQIVTFITDNFMLKELQISNEVWKKVRIEKIVISAKADCDILYVHFNHISDIAVVNSHLRNMDPKSSNKIFQYVPPKLLTRFKAYEKAALQVRNDNNNTVNTKIRPGAEDFYLIVRKKGNKDPWSSILKTPVPVDMNASFEVGDLSPQDKVIEKEYLFKLAKSHTNKKLENKDTYITDLDFEDDDNDLYNFIENYENIPNAINYNQPGHEHVKNVENVEDVVEMEK